MFPRHQRIPRRLLSSPRPPLSARSVSRKSSAWPEPQGAPETPKIRSWVYPVSRIANFLIVPTAILYAVFFADFGDHEHVFMPPRRWLAAQKAAFFSLSPEEQKARRRRYSYVRDARTGFRNTPVIRTRMSARYEHMQ